MSVFVIISTFFDTGLFGVYTTIKRARMAIEHYFREEPNIISFEDVGDYAYEIRTENGDTFFVEIVSGCLDYEFVNGEIKEDE